jgi:hypothetical protein
VRSGKLAAGLLWWVACSAAGQDFEIENRDVGVRRHAGGSDSTPVSFRLRNRSSEPFEGLLRLSARCRSGAFPDEVSTHTSSRSVRLGPSQTADTCVVVPLSVLQCGERLQVELVASGGSQKASELLQTRDAVALADGQVLVGVIAEDADDLQEVQRALLYPRSTEGSLAPPRLKLLPLPMAAVSSCWEAYAELDFLIVTAKPHGMPDSVQAAIKRAAVSGLRVVVNDSSVAPLWPRPGPTADREVRVGRGAFHHVGRFDEAAFSFIRAAASDEQRRIRYETRELSQIFDVNHWARGRFQAPQLPHAELFLALLVAYVLVVGPAIHLFLRRRDQRERGWLVIPSVAFVFGLLCWAWTRAHRFESSRLDSVLWVASREGQREAIATLVMRVSTPRARRYRLMAEGPWSPGERLASLGYDAQSPSLKWDRAGFEIDGLEMRPWSLLDLRLERDWEQDASVVWEGAELRTPEHQSFSEAALVTDDGCYETRGLAGGTAWRYAEGAPARSLYTLIRPSGRTKTSALCDSVLFSTRAEIGDALRQARGLFIGVAVGHPIGITLDPTQVERGAWTLQLQSFPRRR